MDELKKIRDQLRQAEQNFNYADQEYIDAAIHELKATEEKFAAMLKEKRREKNVRSKGKAKSRLLCKNSKGRLQSIKGKRKLFVL